MYYYKIHSHPTTHETLLCPRRKLHKTLTEEYIWGIHVFPVNLTNKRLSINMDLKFYKNDIHKFKARNLDEQLAMLAIKRVID